MNTNRKHSFRKSIYILALGLSMIPGSALAQSAQTTMAGKFSLTSEAQCANKVLAPGNYSFTLTGDRSFAVIRISSDKKLVAAFITPTQMRKITSDQDVLMLVKKSGGPYVQSLDIPELGVEFKFPVPKGAAVSSEVPPIR